MLFILANSLLLDSCIISLFIAHLFKRFIAHSKRVLFVSGTIGFCKRETILKLSKSKLPNIICICASWERIEFLDRKREEERERDSWKFFVRLSTHFHACTQCTVHIVSYTQNPECLHNFGNWNCDYKLSKRARFHCFPVNCKHYFIVDHKMFVGTQWGRGHNAISRVLSSMRSLWHCKNVNPLIT